MALMGDVRAATGVSVEIYLIQNRRNGHRYVGQAKTMIAGRYFGTEGRFDELVYKARSGILACSPLERAIWVHGSEVFMWSILRTVSAEEADAAELAAMIEYGTYTEY